MPLKKPDYTLGGKTWWKVIDKTPIFIVQEHKFGPPVWFGHTFRILIISNNYEIAHASDKDTIIRDWKYILELCQTQEVIEMIDNYGTEELGQKLITYFTALYEKQNKKDNEKVINENLNKSQQLSLERKVSGSSGSNKIEASVVINPEEILEEENSGFEPYFNDDSLEGWLSKQPTSKKNHILLKLLVNGICDILYYRELVYFIII